MREAEPQRGMEIPQARCGARASMRRAERAVSFDISGLTYAASGSMRTAEPGRGVEVLVDMSMMRINV